MFVLAETRAAFATATLPTFHAPLSHRRHMRRRWLKRPVTGAATPA